MQNSKNFNSDDQMSFATLSGDYNPIHTNPVLSRRLMFGEQVVHGIHCLLWALDYCVSKYKNPLFINSIDVNFIKPIKLNHEVKIEHIKKLKYSCEINIITDNEIASKIKITFEKYNLIEHNFIINGYPKKESPKNIVLKDIKQQSGSIKLYLKKNILENNFPNLYKNLSHLHISVLLASTRIIGNKCPGLNSLYSGLKLSFKKYLTGKVINYSVSEYDNTFKLVYIDIKGPEVQGYLKSFIRPTPTNQNSSSKLIKLIKNKEFLNQRVLVIGGSRGLGEIATKLLSSGKADVKFTYFRGKHDADIIKKNINLAGNEVSSFQYDILNNDESILIDKLGDWRPTHLYYFPTPFIFSGKKNKFSKFIFEEFYKYYLTGFYNILKNESLTKTKFIFYPSSIALNELPNNMIEYILAKAAGESLCDFFEKNYKGMLIYKTRLPKLETDQTVSLLPSFNDNTTNVILNEIRLFNKKISEKLN